jgi:large subunit ribosomal protein L23
MKTIIKKPLITEKVSKQAESGVYGFVVDRKANKVEIKKAIEKMYGVNVQNVRTMITPGKKRSRFVSGNFLNGRTSATKRALVQVAEGEIIDIYSNI